MQTAHRLIYLGQKGRVAETFERRLEISMRDSMIDQGLECKAERGGYADSSRKVLSVLEQVTVVIRSMFEADYSVS